MARPADLIEDSTVLDGPRVDVQARVGWLLRVARLGRGVSLRRLSAAMSDLGHPVSVPALSVAERTGVRDGGVIDRYEQVLGLPDGQLRAPLDVLCRTFDYAPQDREPTSRVPVRLAAVDAAFTPVLQGEPTGGQWLRWSRLVRHGGAPVPSVVMAPVLQNLVEELVRSVGPAFTTRYEALAQLRCGPYADLVEDVARDLVLRNGPGPAVVTVFSVLAEQPGPRLLSWCAPLLDHPAPWVVQGACAALEGMRSVGGLEDAEWDVVVAPLVRGQARAGDGPLAGRLTGLVRVLPSGVRRDVLSRIDGPLVPADGPRSWDGGLANRQLNLCGRLGADACDRLEIEHQPLLTRLLFEVLYDFRTPRVATSAWMLMATPFVTHLVPALLALVDDPPDDTTCRGALRAVRSLQVPETEEGVAQWLARAEPWDDPVALSIAGNAGVAVPGGHRRVREAGEEAVSLVESLGMAGHPDLHAVVADDDLPGEVRDAARWWLRVGPRVVG